MTTCACCQAHHDEPALTATAVCEDCGVAICDECRYDDGCCCACEGTYTRLWGWMERQIDERERKQREGGA